MSLLFAAGLFTACGERSSDKNAEARNGEENVEESSGENVSPQLEDSADRFEVDSISSASEANKEKKNELEDGESPSQ